jgi:excinuclease ABC subunit C
MRKSEYRRFNIEDIQPGDDYAAIRQAVQRRYEKLLSGEGVAPTLILIDGGSGQVRRGRGARGTWSRNLPLLGVAKGEARKPGLET